MEENRLLEAMWREAQQVEIPPELSPEQIEKRLSAQPQQNKEQTGNSRNKSRRAGHIFHWHGYGSRVAAAAVVLAVSFGTFTLAERQSLPEDHAQGSVSTSCAAISQVSDSDSLSEDQIQKTDQTELVSATELGDYHQADSYTEVGRMFPLSQINKDNGILTGQGAEDGAEADGVMADSESTSGYVQKQAGISQSMNTEDAMAQKDYSTTNLQVEGVDESDIVKTDGQYIYIATEKQVRIVDTSDGQIRQLGSITPELSGNLDAIREMYVSDDRLVLIVQTEDTDQEVGDTDDTTAVLDIAYISNPRMHTQVLTYDITSPAGARLLGTFEQDGTYHTSRKIGDKVYLFTDYYADTHRLYTKWVGSEYEYGLVPLEGEGASKQNVQQTRTYPGEDDVKEMLPKVQGQTIPSDCIYLPDQQDQGGVLIASFDISEPERVCDRKLIFSGYSTLYVTQDSVILYTSKYSDTVNQVVTSLTKFRITDGQIVADCAESVKGEINDTFALHESSDGYLYVLTTDDKTNRLYVLDTRLKITGQIDHIADGEIVYAARFVDHIGYFVTYRNTDPLFTVDFSDPAHPELIGELEIPGFSDYLQFWDDTHLIGVGEEHGAGGDEFVGIKLSLYDISDPTKVTESGKAVLKDACNAPATTDYKALLADSTKNVIAFVTDDKGENNIISEHIYRVTGGRLQEAYSECIWDKEDYSRSSYDYRNVYIGDRLYLVCADQIIIYDMAEGYQRIGQYDLQ